MLNYVSDVIEDCKAFQVFLSVVGATKNKKEKKATIAEVHSYYNKKFKEDVLSYDAFLKYIHQLSNFTMTDYDGKEININLIKQEEGQNLLT